ncbi:hypothetical protein RFI_31924, partial [Reticulomyxa filosa]
THALENKEMREQLLDSKMEVEMQMTQVELDILETEERFQRLQNGEEEAVETLRKIQQQKKKIEVEKAQLHDKKQQLAALLQSSSSSPTQQFAEEGKTDGSLLPDADLQQSIQLYEFLIDLLRSPRLLTQLRELHLAAKCGYHAPVVVSAPSQSQLQLQLQSQLQSQSQSKSQSQLQSCQVQSGLGEPSSKSTAGATS